MMDLNIYLSNTLIGQLSNDPKTNNFSFTYDSDWIKGKNAFSLGPNLPVPNRATLAHPNPDHSTVVRQFFENLLPEGQGLDAASIQYQISKSNLMGLMIHLGRDLAGAISVGIPGAAIPGPQSNLPDSMSSQSLLRPVSKAELSERIRNRPNQTFSVWDGKIRMSIAGFQDKIVAFEKSSGTDVEWSFVDGGPLASNVIIKPEPMSSAMAGMTGNEFMCMTLARQIGLPTANVRLVHVPEPVLIVDRFDRKTSADGSRVERLHVIDGCQALGISPGFKYERPYGDTRDVKDFRDGASLPKLFAMLLSHSSQPAAQRLALLRWTIFQVLIGNTDAHAKNLTFFCDRDGLKLAPAYDILCAPAFSHSNLDDSYAMAIGDAFTDQELSAYEWAVFANQCAIPPRLVQAEMRKMCTGIVSQVTFAQAIAITNDVDARTISSISNYVQASADRHLLFADQIVQMSREVGPAEQKTVYESPRG